VYSPLDIKMMQRAIALAERGRYTASPNPRVGCVICKDDKIIGEGWHRRDGLAHAEVEALNHCKVDVRDATVYVTLEPCAFHGRTPPCCDTLVKAGIARVVIGTEDPHPKVSGRGSARLLEHGIDVTVGCEAQACADLNPGFMYRMVHKRPYVRVKIAASLDGRTALANGVSQWITGVEARENVQHYRASADAILTGVGTVLHDDPRLTVRLTDEQFTRHGHGHVQQPALAIVDTQLRTPVNAKLFEADRPVIIYTRNKTGRKYPAHCEIIESDMLVERAVDRAAGIDLSEVMRDLGSRQYNEVHVEAGATLCAGLLIAGMMDELLLYMAPHLLGNDAAGLFDFGGLTKMSERPEFEFVDVAQLGNDLAVRLKPRDPGA